MKIVIISPTYNEKDNIAPMIKAIDHERQFIKNHQLHLLYIDDSSPDGTAQEIKKYQKQFSWIHLLLREQKQGLGAAYVAGIKYAIEMLEADAFLEFDADFQHDPTDIKRLVAELNNGYDYVIGSRYIRGGSIPKDWAFNRKFQSVIGNLVARTLLMLPNIHDVTTGFKLTRVQRFADKLSLKLPETPPSLPFSKGEGLSPFAKGGVRGGSHIHKPTLPETFIIGIKYLLTSQPKPNYLFSTQFAYKIQLLFEMVQAGAKIKEVPIHFQPRTKGESKIINNEMVETLRVIYLLQCTNPTIRQFFKFGTVGFMGYVVQAIILEFLARLFAGWPPVNFYLLNHQINFYETVIWGGSAEAAIISNFTWNNLWTFQDKQITGFSQLINKFIHFNFTSVGALLIQITVGSLLVSMFGEQCRQIYLPLVIIFFIIPYNYLIYTKLIWKK